MYEEDEGEQQNTFFSSSVTSLPKVFGSKKKIEEPSPSTSKPSVKNDISNNHNNNNEKKSTITTINTNTVDTKQNVNISLSPISNREYDKLSNSNQSLPSSSINTPDIVDLDDIDSTTTKSVSTTSNTTTISTIKLDIKKENDTISIDNDDDDGDIVIVSDNNNNRNTKSISTTGTSILVKDEKEEKVNFQDEILWNRNSVDTDALDEFLKRRIFDSFKNYHLKPREHQWKTIVQLLKDVIKPQHNKSFRSENRYNYLIQHAAGSGKSLTIAMLVYFLYKIQVNNKFKFDTIVIMNDRTQLDAQLGDIIIKYLVSNGVTNFCRPKSSKQLQHEITLGKTRIIITTMQKFAQLLPSQSSTNRGSKNDEEFAFKYNNVAIITDEAHRSHGKSTTEKLHNFLLGNTKQPGLITYFSFTCTPTTQCLEMFGINQNGNKTPFNTYSMEEALKDKLILDVTSNIIYPYGQQQQQLQSRSGLLLDSDILSQDDYLSQSILDEEYYYYDDDEDVKRSYGSGAIATSGYKHNRLDDDIQDQESIKEKSRFIIRHFIEHKRIMDKGSFRSRAMVICNGRKNLLTFKKEIDAMIAQLPVQEQFDTIAAFSQFAIDGKTITESDGNVNGKYAHYGTDKNRGITKALLDDKYSKIRLILVADKLQTGFDEPSLCLMYVDKKIKGANAVQTLSRLSRIAQEKTTTLIIDFVNNQSEIKKIFQLYRHSTTLRDLQDSSHLTGALATAARDIKEFLSKERNLVTLCRSVVYHESKGNIEKYKSIDFCVESFLDIYHRLLKRGGESIPPLALGFETINTIKETLDQLRLDKARELQKTLDNVKIKIDYFTDEEAKRTEALSEYNVDYDADFAAKLWASEDRFTSSSSSSSSSPKSTVAELTKKLETIQKANNFQSQTQSNIFMPSSGTYTKSTTPSITTTLHDKHLDYNNQNYQTNFTKPIPNISQYVNSNNNNNNNTQKPNNSFKTDNIWAAAGRNSLGKRPINTNPARLTPNIQNQQNKKRSIDNQQESSD
ncbi:helicase superfamily 1 and 2 domain-containing protein [Tieghemostelium lacteum]|uniref:Helicase superfamily 1 and 2 domain-containing protein n=1 Tax=Tieghemostelium lacteum TaxID=361077 RepID=A0A151ZA92_TIELA|nr:helicase superfamily 1 and 2 domain-containing protein [Tieghemostelium lacteum]|eukprot:KYQ90843.1 helicase superfamily 1 and 2 domain-containing protein [Tieghemostelium lacteum]